MKTIPILDATAPGVTVGRHSIWVPALGLKVPFQWGGTFTKYGKREEGFGLTNFVHEVAILRALAADGMAPPVGDVVFVETLISNHPGGWHADPCGAWGYEMADATKLPPGRFSIDAMRRLPIEGSEGAWGDVLKPGNVVNGYLVDVRRSAWDMLKWGGELPHLPLCHFLDADALAAEVHALCQFPKGQRAEAYQDFWLAGQLVRGERRVIERAHLLGFTPQPGESVVEIGCQAGGFLQFAHRAMGGEGAILGVELDPDYVRLGRALARSCGQNICIRQMDAVAERDALLSWLRQRCPRGVDHLLVLSMEKHLGHGPLFDLVDAIGARWTYVETNAVAVDDGVGAMPSGPMKLWSEVHARAGVHIGESRDRNLRRLYRIGNPLQRSPSPCV